MGFEALRLILPWLSQRLHQAKKSWTVVSMKDDWKGIFCRGRSPCHDQIIRTSDERAATTEPCQAPHQRAATAADGAAHHRGCAFCDALLALAAGPARHRRSGNRGQK